MHADRPSSARPPTSRVRLRQIVGESARWVPVGLVPLLNGIVRTSTYQAALGERLSGFLSAFLDIAMITAYAGLLRPAASPALRPAVWLSLTTLFHFALGRLFGLTFAESLGKYDLLAGEPWMLVNLAILSAPFVQFRRRADLASKARPRSARR